jgi:adenosylcobinamide-phosphate synthase
LDDLANLAPSRITAALACVFAPSAGGPVSGSVVRTWRIWRRDGSHHPSPNAGQCEAAFAGALAITLGGANVYEGTVDARGVLGDGPPASARDIDRAVRLSRWIGVAAAAAAVLLAGSRRG